jgi:hypothetical protein
VGDQELVRPDEGFRDLPRRARRWLARRFLLDPLHGAGRTVLLAGSGRSGTTWLAEVLERAGRYRYLFEPFHPDRLPATRSFRPRQYLAPGSPDSLMARAVEDVVAGRVRGRWVDQYNDRLVSRRRLVKDVWANLLLGYLAERHPELAIVLVLRHPVAVVRSQLALSRWDWYVDPGHLLGQERLMADHLEPYRSVLEGARPGPEQHAATWCAENLVPLRQLGPGRAHVLFYEHLVARPDEELGRLATFLRLPPPTATGAAAGRPSRLARSASAVVTGGDAVGGWTATVPRDEVAQVLAVVEGFGLDHLYSSDPMPVPPGGDQAFRAG